MQLTPLDIKISFFFGQHGDADSAPITPNMVNMFHFHLDHRAHTANLDLKI